MDKRPSKVEQELYRLRSNWSEEELKQLSRGLLGINFDKEEQAKHQARTEYITLKDVERAKEIAKNFGLPLGLKSGYWQIDNMVAGFAPGEVTVIGGGTSMGKSMLAVNIFAQQAMMEHKVVFVTLETLKDQFIGRLVSVMGEEQMNWCVLRKTMKIQSEPRLDWRSIKYLVRDVKQNDKAEIVYIDHLHYFSQGEDDDASKLGEITQEFCSVAKENEIPIVLLSQLRRTPEREVRPRVMDLKGSSYIEQNADVVLSVWQEKSKIPQPHIIVGIEKNRNRPIWKPEVGQATFYRDGLKILPTPYDMVQDAAFNETKRFLNAYNEALEKGEIKLDENDKTTYN